MPSPTPVQLSQLRGSQPVSAQHRERHVVGDPPDVSELHLDARVERDGDFPMGRANRSNPTAPRFSASCRRSPRPEERRTKGFAAEPGTRRSPPSTRSHRPPARRSSTDAVVVADAVTDELVQFAVVGRKKAREVGLAIAEDVIADAGRNGRRSLRERRGSDHLRWWPRAVCRRVGSPTRSRAGRRPAVGRR